jgi:hypothetical protein
MTTTNAKSRRGPRPAWLRYLALCLIWTVGVPVKTLLGKRWPRTLSRAMTRMLATWPAYRPTAHDVLVGAYFKSGTNWTMQLVVQIAHRGRAEFDHIHDLVPWPEVPARAGWAVPITDESGWRASPTGLRAIKTHLPLGVVPYEVAARYICVVRDPKDVFVSSYHFTRSAAMGPMMPTVAEWLDAYLSPDTPVGSWAAHLASFWALRERPNVLFLTYESMRADLRATVERIAAFMGVTLTAEERDAVVRRSTFEHMKTIGAKFDPVGSPWADARGAMIRRGQRGGSDELVTPEQQRRIDDYWRAELARMGCDFPYDEAFEAARTATAPPAAQVMPATS